MHEFNIEEIDSDGALRESAEEAMQDTRLDFLKKAGVGVAGVASGGALLGLVAVPEAFASADRPPVTLGSFRLGRGDIGILNFAYVLELLEGAFYDQAFKNLSGKIDPKTEAFLRVTKTDEDAHRTFLRRALGSKAIRSPKFKFGNSVTDVDVFRKTSYALEKTGVGAYSGQAGNIKSKATLLQALSIVTVEARHTGAIASIIGAQIAPHPFDRAVGAKGTLKAVKNTKFIVGL